VEKLNNALFVYLKRDIVLHCSYIVGKYSGEIKQCFACLSEKRFSSSYTVGKYSGVAVAFC
jgi:hypothetical protein